MITTKTLISNHRETKHLIPLKKTETLGLKWVLKMRGWGGLQIVR